MNDLLDELEEEIYEKSIEKERNLLDYEIVKGLNHLKIELKRLKKRIDKALTTEDIEKIEELLNQREKQIETLEKNQREIVLHLTGKDLKEWKFCNEPFCLELIPIHPKQAKYCADCKEIRKHKDQIKRNHRRKESLNAPPIDYYKHKD